MPAGRPRRRPPDETRCHRLADCCACGPDLAASAGVRVKRSHQVHDLRDIAVKMTEHHVWRVHCGRGQVHVGALPGRYAGPGPVRFGMRIAGPLTR